MVLTLDNHFDHLPAPRYQAEGVYTEPAGAAEQADYRQRQDYGAADTAPLVLDGLESGLITMRDLLP
jgi:hypothetical protein